MSRQAGIRRATRVSPPARAHGDAALLDLRGAALASAVVVPLAAVLFVVLWPWASELRPADFSTAESLAIGPSIAAALVLVWVAYRPLLAATIVDRRRSRETRVGATPLGLLVQSSPLVAGLFAPLFGAGKILPTAVVGVIVVLFEIALLERQRRGSSGRELAWSDPALEAYRLRWAVAAVALAIAVAFVSLGATPQNESEVVGIASFAIPLVVLSPIWLAVAAFAEDEWVVLTTRIRGLAAAALMLALPLVAEMARSNDVLNLAAAVAGCVVLLPLVDGARRSAATAHAKRLVAEGHADDIRRTYAWVRLDEKTER